MVQAAYFIIRLTLVELEGPLLWFQLIEMLNDNMVSNYCLSNLQSPFQIYRVPFKCIHRAFSNLPFKLYYNSCRYATAWPGSSPRVGGRLSPRTTHDENPPRRVTPLWQASPLAKTTTDRMMNHVYRCAMNHVYRCACIPQFTKIDCALKRVCVTFKR